MASIKTLGLAAAFVGVTGSTPPAHERQEASRESQVSYYEQGMRFWREGNAAEALRYLMTATKDRELSFYAARQVSLMGEYALPVLYQGLWHREEDIQRQSAIILGWIGDARAVEPLLLRMKYPDAPLEVEYALRKIGSLAGAQILSVIDLQDLSNPKLLDHKTASIARLADGLRLAVDSVPLFDLLAAMEAAKARELEQQPYGHLANARLNILRFLAGRRVSRAAPPLARCFQADAEPVNLAVSEALIGLGAAALEPLARAFKSSRDGSLRALLAVTHYLGSGAGGLSSSGPISVVLNEAQSDAERAEQTAACAARLSTTPNPLLLWFQYHPDPRVRTALAPDLPEEVVRSRPELIPFYLEKSRDNEAKVAAAHVEFVAKYLPDARVESRLEQLLRSPGEIALLRQAALRAVARRGSSRLLLTVLNRPGDPLRAEAVELSAHRNEPEIVNSVLSILSEAEPSEAKRAAIRVAAAEWRRAEAARPLLELVRVGDPLWKEAAKGLAALSARGAEEYFAALIDSGRRIDRDEAGAIYFALSGIPSRLIGSEPGSFRFEPLDLESRPPANKVLVVLREQSDLRGWVKVEERWEGKRLFRLDEARRELVLYDRESYDRVSKGAAVIVLEETIRQTILNPLELSELRKQRVDVVENLPHFPFAGLDGMELRLVHEGQWKSVRFGKDLRDESGRDGWGRSAVVPLELFDRDRILWEPHPPPEGWPRDQAQPIHPAAGSRGNLSRYGN